MLQGYLDQNENWSTQQAVDEIRLQEEKTAAARVLQCPAVNAIG